MHTLSPPSMEICPTTFKSKVKHLRHLFAFLPYDKFKHIIRKYLPHFVFEKHGPDIEKAVAIFSSLDESVLFINALWDECHKDVSDKPQLDLDVQTHSSQWNIPSDDEIPFLSYPDDEVSPDWDS
eukprot:TRINITY_DN2395_c1_g1_i5.p1 TRINITY_DN2395_c1_g1~~TRINITY_DN2395_c1_g1_i5.p1  ORF type:complete len:125 (-),score=9.52 TRINITY_DN2395_c1_g1_i5:44-418(-)